MKYFCYAKDRSGSAYHEFYKGKWDHTSFWKSDSILLHDDTLEALGLCTVLAEVLPGYDRHGVTELNQSQWESILDHASQLNTEAKIALTEAEAWAKDAFENGNMITIFQW